MNTKPRVEIVVLKYKEPEVEWKCAQTILYNTNWPFKLVLFDTRMLDTNFSRIWNERIRESTCDYVLIMDSDTEVWPGWLDHMMQVFDEKSDVAAVVPRTDHCGHIPQMETPADNPICKTGIASGFCVLYKKEIFEHVGFFDEDFNVYGQDSEWFNRAIRKGFSVYLAPRAFVHHIGNYSTKKAAQSGAFDWAEEARSGNDLYLRKTS